MLYLGKEFDKFADSMAGWIERNKPTVRPATPEEQNKPFGFNPPTPEQRKKGFGWEFNIPLDKIWDSLKGNGFWNIFGPGVSGISSAHAGELPYGAAGAPKGSEMDPLYVKPIADLTVGPGMPGGTGWQPGLFAGPYGTTPAGRFAGPGAGYGPGRGAGSNAAIGNLGVRGFWTADKEEQAYDALVAQGASPDAAVGLISRWRYVEFSGGPTSVNPGSGAFGIGQWLTARRKRAIAGDTDFAHQLAYVGKEWSGDELRSFVLATAVKGDDEAARAATAYERAEGWNAGFNTDFYTARTKAGIAQVRKELEGLVAAKADQSTIIKKADGAAKGNVHIPNVYHNGQSSEYPAPGEKSSMMNMKLFQQD